MPKKTLKHWCVEAFGQMFQLLGAGMLVLALYRHLNSWQAEINRPMHRASLEWCLPFLLIPAILLTIGTLICRHAKKYAKACPTK